MITIPSILWTQMLDAFAGRQLEQVAYFDGVALPSTSANKIGVVTTLTIPQASLAARRFEVRPDQMSEAGKHLRALRMVRLAQVHTHPEGWTGHSPWDDERAYSQLPGALSIVLPFYGLRRPALADSGVHVREPSGWRELRQEEVPEWVRVVPSVFDFRCTITHPEEEDSGKGIKSSRRRSWWNFLTFFGDRTS